jgi:hypothetical protein
MLTRSRIWVIGRAPSVGLRAPLASSESIVLQQHFTLLVKRHYRGMAVTLWARR